MACEALLMLAVEECMNRFGHCCRDAINQLEIGQPGPADRLGRAEMGQQRPFARRADAGNLVERCGADGFRAFRPVDANGESVGLVAQTLNEIEAGAAKGQGEGALTGGVEFLLAGVAVDALGDAKQGDHMLLLFDRPKRQAQIRVGDETILASQPRPSARPRVRAVLPAPKSP